MSQDMNDVILIADEVILTRWGTTTHRVWETSQRRRGRWSSSAPASLKFVPVSFLASSRRWLQGSNTRCPLGCNGNAWPDSTSASLGPEPLLAGWFLCRRSRDIPISRSCMPRCSSLQLNRERVAHRGGVRIWALSGKGHLLPLAIPLACGAVTVVAELPVDTRNASRCDIRPHPPQS